MLRESFIALALLAGAVSGAQAADAAKGKDIFKRCVVCHTVAKDGGNSLGPNLFGIVGRKAGAVSDFTYSAPMKNSTKQKKLLLNPPHLLKLLHLSKKQLLQLLPL